MRGPRISRRPSALGLLVLLGAASGDAAEPAWSAGRVEVVRVLRPDVLEVGRGTQRAPLRLVGLVAPGREDGRLLREALGQVHAWVEAGPVRLAEPRATARGEVSGLLRLADGTLLNERLLAGGYALLDPSGLEPTRLDAFGDAQRWARARKAGLWGLARVRVERADRVADRFATVCGNAGVIRRDRDGSWLLHLGPAYPRHEFTARIPRERVHAFGRPDEEWLRHDLCVTGRVRRGLAAPETELWHPTQLEDLGGLRAR